MVSIRIVYTLYTSQSSSQYEYQLIAELFVYTHNWQIIPIPFPRNALRKNTGGRSASTQGRSHPTGQPPREPRSETRSIRGGRIHLERRGQTPRSPPRLGQLPRRQTRPLARLSASHQSRLAAICRASGCEPCRLRRTGPECL